MTSMRPTSFSTYELTAPATGVVAVSGVIDLSVNGAATLPELLAHGRRRLQQWWYRDR